jgi:hypothetical protein
MHLLELGRIDFGPYHHLVASAHLFNLLSQILVNFCGTCRTINLSMGAASAVAEHSTYLQGSHAWESLRRSQILKDRFLSLIEIRPSCQWNLLTLGVDYRIIGVS